jgi:hypothetical protein
MQQSRDCIFKKSHFTHASLPAPAATIAQFWQISRLKPLAVIAQLRLSQPL